MLKQKQQKVFAESWIVVPNHSAKQWLQKSLAKDLGVCSQIKFIMPLSFNWEIIKNVVSQEHNINIFTSDVLRWQIFKILNEDSNYQNIRQDSDLKNFNLAEKIAQTLLTYNEEYPAIIAKWDKEVYEVSEHDNWQIEMWIQLQKNLPTKSPVELLELFDAEKDFTQTPAHIILFTTEQLTSLQKATILKLSKSQQIELFLTNCSPNDYWFDLKPEATKARNEIFKSDDIIEVGNPLLSNLGYNKMAIFDAFLQEDIYLQDSDNHYKGTSLLQSLKIDIAELQEKPKYCNADDTIKIHSCYNRKREVEIIKDDILTSLNDDNSLNPEDIIVVAPDINGYVESIKDTFANDNEHYLPFHIDRVQLADNHYIIALIKLINSFTKEMSASNIYELFCQTSLLKKLKINENDLPTIKNWILNSNIRNFYSAQHKLKQGFEGKVGNTWQFGKNRWLSGYLADDNDVEYLSTYGDIAGQEELFTHCFEFIDLWFRNFEKAKDNYTPKQWFKLIRKLCKDFLYNDLQDDYEKKILDQLENKLLTQTLDCQQKVPLVIILNIVETVITENNFRSEGQIGIRFQTWENAFIADAKLLIIMGLNDNEFPKKQIKNDLNMFKKTPSRLNKSTRQRDKNLMLTALTESTDKLIMSYIGFNAKTNDTQPPSVVLAEIISYLQQKTENEFKVNLHKMHGYNKCYFDGEHSSYSLQNFKLAKNFYDKRSIDPQEDVAINLEEDKEIKLNDLISFFVDPLQYFLKNQANINFSIYEDNLQDAETYSPTGLEGWKLKQEIFTNGQSTAVKTGIVSDNNSGRTTISKYVDELNYITKLKNNKKLEKYYIEKSIGEYKVSGSVDTDDKQQLVSIYPSELKTKSKLLCQHWIKHLCYNSSQSSFAYFQDKTVEFQPIENNDVLLLEILNKWRDSFSKPWLLCPHTLLKTLTSSIGIQKRKDYLASFIEAKNTFPSEGQKYFAEDVKEINEQTEGITFLKPIIDSVMVTKV